MLKSLRFWIGLAITLLFLSLFLYPLYRTGFAEMGRALREANYFFLLPAILVYFIGVFFRSVRWRYLLKPLGNFSSFRLFPLIVIGFLVNNILPARLGIVARAYILGERERISKMATAGTVVVEQVFDGLTLLSFLVITLLFVPLADWAKSMAWIMALLFLGALVLLVLITFSERLTGKVTELLVRFLPGKWGRSIASWLDSFIKGLGILRSPRKLLIVFTLSVLAWLTEAGVFYILALSFNLGQPFYVLLLATSLSNLAWALLMTQGGLGSFDLACQQTLVSFGVTVGIASSYVLVLHAILLLPATALGFIFLWRENLSLAKIVPRRERLAESYDGNAALEDEE
ncbi:MAG: flippase-like domain-containing protein [Dehalococcoidia bacterium]|nr:MAG: flippase-like domain-containing protein [Dehalococcoidia bacterium]